MWQGSSWNVTLHEKFIEELPYLKKDWRELARNHAVRWIIVENSFEQLTSKLLNWTYDLSGLPKIAETPRYSAYAVTVVEEHDAQFNSDKSEKMKPIETPR